MAAVTASASRAVSSSLSSSSSSSPTLSSSHAGRARRGTPLTVPTRSSSSTLSQKRQAVVAAAAAATGTTPKVVIAGGGIAGLVTAIALRNKGVEVRCLERVKEYKPWGGPIQMAGNAMAALQRVDADLARDVVTNGTVTGDRLNGLLDGMDGEWFVRFDCRKPSLRNQLPLTVVMSRFELINRLRAKLESLGGDTLKTGVEVMRYEELPGGRVRAHLDDGTTEEGDVLIACDGIRSRCRSQLKNVPALEKNLDKGVANVADAPNYCGYTCYAAISDYEPENIEEIGYQVFLGTDAYFVSSDVGEGRQQWYAFVKQEAGMDDEGIDRKAALLERFKGWCPQVIARLENVRTEDVERRDIYDRPPTLNWVKGRVALLGDAAHAMQPNMGQGGCQAIEDAAALAEELSKVGPGGVERALQFYQFRRVLRASAITGFAAMASIMNSTYRRYLGSDPYKFYEYIPGAIPFWNAVEKLKIPHPGRVVGQIAMLTSIDVILQIITAGGDKAVDGKALLDSQEMRKLDEKIFEMEGPWGFAK